MSNFTKNLLLWVTIILVVLLLFNLFQNGNNQKVTTELAYSDFVSSVKAGNIREATISGSSVSATTTAGRVVTTFSPQGAFDVQHYHKNLHRLREGKQPLKNIPHHTSFVPHSYNFGRIVGALHRVTRSSIGTPNTFRGCINLLDEHIFSMQFPVKLILQAIYRMERSAPAYAPTWAALKAYYQPMQGW